MVSIFLKKRSLLFRLTAMFMAVASFSTLITLLVMSVYQINILSSAEIRRVNSLAQILAPNVTASLIFNDKETIHELIEPLAHQDSVVMVSVIDEQGDEFTSIDIAENAARLDKQALTKTEASLEAYDSYYGSLIIYTDDSSIRKHVSFYLIFLGAIFIAIIILGFFLSLFASKRFIYPILRLAAVVNKVTHSHDYSIRATFSSFDEIGDLTKGFNSMLETISLRDNLLESTVQQRTGELKKANIELRDQAYKDSLSGLPNRRYIYELINEVSKNSETHTFSLLFLDLDGFKEVNDTLGHDYGDLLIVDAAKRIQAIINKGDTLARLGGDEFTIFLENVVEPCVIESIANRIRYEFNKPFLIRDESVHITASIGASSYPECGKSAEEIMKKADLAMYDAKSSGRNCYRFFHASMLEKLEAKKLVISDLRQALKNDELELFYQPIYNIETRKIDKAEALIRWHHPAKGVISPQDFIPIAEENGLIVELGNWVLQNAIANVRVFRQNLCPEFCVNINVSAAQLKPEDNWLSELILSLDTANLGANAIAIEITETALMTDRKKVVEDLRLLKEKGVEIAIDDFGVGYSSLSYLQQLKIDIIKIDKSFVQQLGIDSAGTTLCKTIAQMAKNLNIKVVAEGIEDEIQLEMLTEFGCHFGQGYFIAKPAQAKKFETFFHSFKPAHITPRNALREDALL